MFKFRFNTVQRIIFGIDSFQNLGVEARNLGAKKVLLVVDRKLCEMGLGKKAVDLLEEKKVGAVLYEQGEVEPEVGVADECTKFCKDNACDFVIGIGGGSTLDTAKAAAVLMTNEGSASEYQGVDTVRNPGLRTIMIPTTAGTGSEVTPTAVFINREKGIKLGINSPYLFPTLALLDPRLTVSLPSDLTASTGMDALTHAIEAYVAMGASPITDMLAVKAMELIWGSLSTAVRDGKNLSARSKMLLGSCLGGMAIANAGVGASHAISYALSTFFKVPHGVANGMLIPHIMRYNFNSAIDKFVIIAQKLGVSVDELAPEQAALAACNKVKELTEDIKIPNRLSSFGVTESSIPQLASNAMLLKRVINNNPRVITRADIEKILYEML